MPAFHRLSMLFVILYSVLLHVNGFPISQSNNLLARYDPSAINRLEDSPLPARQDNIPSRPNTLKCTPGEKPRPLPVPPPPRPLPLPPQPPTSLPKPRPASPSDTFPSDANPSDKVVKLLLASSQLSFTAPSLKTLPDEELFKKFAMAQLLSDFSKDYVKQFGLTAEIKKILAKVKLLVAATKLLIPPVPPKGEESASA